MGFGLPTAIAAGFGVRAVDLGAVDDPDATLRALFSAEGPSVVRVPVDYQANVYPMVPPGAANEEAIGDYEQPRAAEESA